MIKTEDAFFKILIASLPVLGHTIYFRESFLMGALVAFSFWISVPLFRSMGNLLSKTSYEAAVLFWISLLVVLAGYVAPFSPFWGVSLFLLLFPRKGRGRLGKAFWARTFWLGFGFWMLLAFLGVMHQILGQVLWIPLFQQPTGSFLLLAVMAFLWQNLLAREAS